MATCFRQPSWAVGTALLCYSLLAYTAVFAFKDDSKHNVLSTDCECRNTKLAACTTPMLKTCYNPLFKRLTLSSNQLSGTIGEAFISKLAKEFNGIKWLTLDTNQLSGTLPVNIHNLPALNTLSLGSNRLTGVLPQGLSSLSNLNLLGMDCNQLSGSLHALFNGDRGVTNLANLNMQNNMFNSSVPPQLFTLKKIYTIYLDNNRLTGKLPTPPENGTGLLQELSLSSNKLTGHVHTRFGTYFTKLTDLYLDGNVLSGNIPESLIQSSSLQVLYIYNNGLGGAIPDAFPYGCKLKQFLVQNNYFTGRLPRKLARCTDLWSLLMWKNGFNGQIPESYGQLTSLQDLDISSNKLTGTLPLSLSSLVNMKTFIFADNRIEGALCPALEGLKFTLQKCNGMKSLLRCDENATVIDKNLAACGGQSQCKLCNENICSEPNLPGSAYGTCLGKKNGETCEYECAPGYVSKKTHQTIKCEHGEWVDIEQAECQFCNFCCGPVPPTLADHVDKNSCRGWPRVDTIVNGTKTKGLCNFTCADNYKLDGDNVILCQRGSWEESGPSGTCRPVQCDGVKESKLEYIDPTSCSEGQPGEQCHFHCRLPFANKGNQHITCVSGSDWDIGDAHCSVLTCSGLTWPSRDPETGTAACLPNLWVLFGTGIPLFLVFMMLIALYCVYNRMVKDKRTWGVMVTMESDGQMSLESDWYLTEALCKEVNFEKSKCGEFESCVLSEGSPESLPESNALLRRVRRFFHSGGVKRRNNSNRLTFVRMEIIRNEKLFTKFKAAVCNMERRTSANPAAFAMRFPDDGVKPQIFRRLTENYLQTPGLEHCHILLAWHGCSLEVTRSICAFGAVDLRKVDGGFFGSGIYLTPFSSYAATYSKPIMNAPEVEEQGLHAMVLCMVVVCNTYPISRKTDYAFPNILDHGSYSHFHYLHPVPYNVEKGKFEINKAVRTDKGLFRGFDSHFVRISRAAHYQAVDMRWQADYDEIVVKAEEQVLPIAVVYFRKRNVNEPATTPDALASESKTNRSTPMQQFSGEDEGSSLLQAAQKKFRSVRSFFNNAKQRRLGGAKDQSDSKELLRRPFLRRASDSDYNYGATTVAADDDTDTEISFGFTTIHSDDDFESVHEASSQVTINLDD